MRQVSAGCRRIRPRAVEMEKNVSEPGSEFVIDGGVGAKVAMREG